MIWFVTPAYGRYDLTAICLEQRRFVVEALAAEGVPATCVVVADDENLDIARSFGFAIVERDNEWLGRKFNDGIEYAARNGAHWVVPIGSDSWIHPDFFLPLPCPGETRTARYYCPVEAGRMAMLRVDVDGGAGPYMLERKALARTAFRPARDALRKGIDRSILEGIRPDGVQWAYWDLHPLQYVGFRGRPHLTRYGGLRDRWGTDEITEPSEVWATLATAYPRDLVKRARAYMEAA